MSIFRSIQLNSWKLLIGKIFHHPIMCKYSIYLFRHVNVTTDRSVGKSRKLYSDRQSLLVLTHSSEAVSGLGTESLSSYCNCTVFPFPRGPMVPTEYQFGTLGSSGGWLMMNYHKFVGIIKYKDLLSPLCSFLEGC
jgi:hypothetical protein